jgi:hypothetical protein
VHAGQRHPGHHVHPPVRQHLGGHGQHRLGLRPAGHRRLVRGHRDGQRRCARAATSRAPCCWSAASGGHHKTTRDDLAWEIQEEVEAQVQSLTGLNQQAKGLYRDENVFEDADIQMAGYAAALRVLTRYAIIDGRDMTAEALRPRVKGETTFVDGLIAFAVDTANQCLVPQGIPKPTGTSSAAPSAST